MSFLSLDFPIFFLLFLAVYWAARNMPEVQNILVLVAGYFILSSMHPYFSLVLGLYTLGIHGCACLIASRRQSGAWYLWLSLCFAVANLAVFKYFDFFRDGVNAALQAAGLEAWFPGLQIMVPLGISFYTFHSISYLVSLQRGEVPLVGLTDLALFLGFFPCVVAGPINRAVDFLPQITRQAPRSLEQFPRALALIALAVVKIVWLGAFLENTWVDPVFDNPSAFHSLDVLLGLLAYAWQIYLNFSGYTDLVTGMALLLGFQLPQNFNAPYLATNLREFWLRWHISLSRWIRDYLYIPLGGSRAGFGRTQVNLMIAMALSGLWHGASLNFLIWGVIHGLGIVLLNCADHFFGRGRIGRHAPGLANAATVAYVAFAWIFFRNQTLGQSGDFIAALCCNFQETLQFNSPWYLLLMWLMLRVYPHVHRLRDLVIAHIGRLHWSALPLVIVLVFWLSLSLAPAGIPGFIYASF